MTASWNAPTDRTTGDVITATIWNDLLGASGSLQYLKDNAVPTTSYTTSDFTKNADTTVSNVTGLSFSIGASEVWYFEVDAQCKIPATPGMDMAFTVPSGAAVTGSYISATTSTIRSNRVANWTAENQVFASGATAEGKTCRLSGVVVNSSTAGTVQLQAAQNTSNASDCIIYAGSFIIAWRLA